MLAQNLERKAGKTRRRKAIIIVLFASLFICVFALGSCGSKPADLRALVPADSLVYLESNDLGAVMKAIIERPVFREAAKEIPDFSYLNGVKLAVAVTGFETKEVPVTVENSILNFTPRFVAVLETNAWNYQALAFTEHKLGEFINNVYDGEVMLETSDKHDGKYFVWTANDGRKAFALVQGSVVFFGNDQSSIEKCLAVKRGEADPISKNPRITDGDRLAFGYVSQDGVAQIANLISIKFASEASDEPESRGAIAGLLPQLIRSTVTDVSWTAKSSDSGVEDVFSVSMPVETATILNETMAPGAGSERSLVADIPPEFHSVSFYNFRDARVAWRSVTVAIQKDLEPSYRSVGAILLNSLFEPYGIGDPEAFLTAAGPTFLTVTFDRDADAVAVITPIRDEKEVFSSLSKELEPATVPDNKNGRSWLSRDRQLRALIKNNKVVSGESSATERLNPADNGGAAAENQNWDGLRRSEAPITTIATENAVASRLVKIVTDLDSADLRTSVYATTYTGFSQQGIERRTVSDFGIIGWLITQFAGDQ